jgi:hypothetical protein
LAFKLHFPLKIKTITFYIGNTLIIKVHHGQRKRAVNQKKSVNQKKKVNQKKRVKQKKKVNQKRRALNQNKSVKYSMKKRDKIITWMLT